jgi:hypothetical protein
MSETSSPTQTTTAMPREERLQILLTEMELLQGRFDKYDDLIFRNREWVITVVVALLGAALTLSRPQLGVLAAWAPALFFLAEMSIRFAYWYKYVDRYRFIRDTLNSGSDIFTISMYDLTNKYNRKYRRLRRVGDQIRSVVFKVEPLIFYGGIVLFTIILRQVVIDQAPPRQGSPAPRTPTQVEAPATTR